MCVCVCVCTCVCVCVWVYVWACACGCVCVDVSVCAQHVKLPKNVDVKTGTYICLHHPSRREGRKHKKTKVSEPVPSNQQCCNADLTILFAFLLVLQHCMVPTSSASSARSGLCQQGVGGDGITAQSKLLTLITSAQGCSNALSWTSCRSLCC